MSEESPTSTITITDADRKTFATGKLFQTMASDAKLRRKVLGLIKEAAPDTIIPELDVEADMDRRVTEAVKPHAEASAALQERLDKLEAAQAREDARRAVGLDEDELVEVENFAKEHGVTKLDKATELYRMQQTSLGTPRATRDPGADDYRAKLRKINPRDVNSLKRAAIEEGTRVLRSMRRTG